MFVDVGPLSSLVNHRLSFCLSSSRFSSSILQPHYRECTSRCRKEQRCPQQLNQRFGQAAMFSKFSTWATIRIAQPEAGEISQRMATRRHPTRNNRHSGTNIGYLLFSRLRHEVSLLATTWLAVKYSKETDLVLVDGFSWCRLLGDRMDRLFLCDFADICVSSSGCPLHITVDHEKNVFRAITCSLMSGLSLPSSMTACRFACRLRVSLHRFDIVGHSGIGTHTTANALDDSEENTDAHNACGRSFESPNLATGRRNFTENGRSPPPNSRQSSFRTLLATTWLAIKYTKETDLVGIRRCRNDCWVLVDDFSLCRLFGDRADRRFSTLPRMHFTMPKSTQWSITIERARLEQAAMFLMQIRLHRMAAHRDPTRGHRHSGTNIGYLLFSQLRHDVHLATTWLAIKYTKETNLVGIQCCRNDCLVLVDDFSLCRLFGDRVDRLFLCDFADICVA
ncbi:unnamed protein product, partial [Mesorhabditis belari]|uniref:Uncharacterized protein n=1 Tax=Mesorhabditis belari TaxID=2138241 RepID=A0AAF3ESC5_9BILA